MENVLPQLDTNILQQKANEYAMKGVLDALSEYYTGYNSPYKKAILENLVNKGVDDNIDIPDIIGVLNESISKEIDVLANTAVSKTFIPLVKKFLTRADAEVKLSDILEEFIKYSDYSSDDDLDMYDYRVEFVKDDGSFLYLTIGNNNISFELHFYKKSKKDETPFYELYTLPYVQEKNEKSYSSYKSKYFTEKKMKISVDNVALELPFTPNVLQDDFMSYIAKLIIANSKITFDKTDFEEYMFPERNCSCR